MQRQSQSIVHSVLCAKGNRVCVCVCLRRWCGGALLCALVSWDVLAFCSKVFDLDLQHSHISTGQNAKVDLVFKENKRLSVLNTLITVTSHSHINSYLWDGTCSNVRRSWDVLVEIITMFVLFVKGNTITCHHHTWHDNFIIYLFTKETFIASGIFNHCTD